MHALGFEKVKKLRLMQGKNEIFTSDFYEMEYNEVEWRLEEKKQENKKLFRGFNVEEVSD